MIRSVGKTVLLAPALLALGLAACSQQPARSSAASAEPVEKTFTVALSTPSTKVDFLTGELRDLTITERVDPKTGNVIDPPELRGTLKIKNMSKDQSAQLLGGTLAFVDAKGQPMALGKDRTSDDSFTFGGGYDTQRLNPGQDTSQSIDVPFPRAGLKPADLKSVRLNLRYLPAPYREQSAEYPASLKG